MAWPISKARGRACHTAAELRQFPPTRESELGARFAVVKACAACCGAAAPLSLPLCRFHCFRSVCGVARVKVNEHLWAAAHIPEGQKN